MMELRRKLLRGGVSATLLAPLIGTGLLMPRSVLANEWQQKAFSATKLTDALKEWGVGTTTDSRDIVIHAEEISVDSSKVRVGIEIGPGLAHARTLAIFADGNPKPLCAQFVFHGPAAPYVELPLRLAKTTQIRAIARGSDGKHYVALREIKVTLGGCGA